MSQQWLQVTAKLRLELQLPAGHPELPLALLLCLPPLALLLHLLQIAASVLGPLLGVPLLQEALALATPLLFAWLHLACWLLRAHLLTERQSLIQSLRHLQSHPLSPVLQFWGPANTLTWTKGRVV